MASPSADVLAQLSALEMSSAPQGDKAAAFTALLHTIVGSGAPPAQLTHDLAAFIDTVLSDAVGIATSRPVLGACVAVIGRLDDAAVKTAAFDHALARLRPKTLSFEEQDCLIREALADLHEAGGDHAAAARVLQGIQLNPHQRPLTDAFRLRIYIRIMRNLLEADDPVPADVLSRAALLVPTLSAADGDAAAQAAQAAATDPTDPRAEAAGHVLLQFQMCQARILDTKCDFLNACSKYHQLSLAPAVAEPDRMQCLSAAMTCAILAGAGPLRARALATLYKDERAPQLLPRDYALLENMHLDRLLDRRDVDEFAARRLLRPHQRATLADGTTTVLTKAVVEHNLLGASRVYNNIGVDELGLLLGLSPDRAEEYAARMIEQGRLGGSIDQIDRLIYFDAPAAASAAAEHRPAHHMRRWDDNVAALAQAVEAVTTLVQNQYPVRYPVSPRVHA